MQKLAQQLLPLYGDAATGATGNLAFQHDLANESIIGGDLSGTYVSLHDDAGQAIGEIEALEAADTPAGATPTYGGLQWTAFMQANGETGYWAPDGDGQYYYFGPDGTLYLDSYPYQVQSGDLGNAVGNVATYNFPSSTLPEPAQDYGDLNWYAFQLPSSGGVGYWASEGNGDYYYFGPDGTLYLDSYPGEVQPGDLSNAIGNVATYQFPSVGLAV
jgi:hypothetical protein